MGGKLISLLWHRVSVAVAMVTSRWAQCMCWPHRETVRLGFVVCRMLFMLLEPSCWKGSGVCSQVSAGCGPIPSAVSVFSASESMLRMNAVSVLCPTVGSLLISSADVLTQDLSFLLPPAALKPAAARELRLEVACASLAALISYWSVRTSPRTQYFQI